MLAGSVEHLGGGLVACIYDLLIHLKLYIYASRFYSCVGGHPPRRYPCVHRVLTYIEAGLSGLVSILDSRSLGISLCTLCNYQDYRVIYLPTLVTYLHKYLNKALASQFLFSHRLYHYVSYKQASIHRPAGEKMALGRFVACIARARAIGTL